MHNTVPHSKKTLNYAVVGLIGAMTLISGCATTTPHENASLERAKGILADLKNDPAVTQNEDAAQYLAEADKALAKSQYKNDSLKFFKPGDDQEDVDHWAYIAEQKALTAKAMIEDGSETEELAKLQLELDQALLAKQELDAAEALRLEERLAQERLAQEKLQQERDADLLAMLKSTEEAGALVERTDTHIKITFNNPTFESNKTDLKPEFESQLESLAKTLTASAPEATLVVRGHSDASGPENYNRELSEERATSVKTFLITQGVQPSRVSSEGLGESSPVASNASPEGRAQNRRIELIINE
ncbi:hypothetical protein MNBD_GAMMA16-1614 [hydrothermal vent metagenome]|uniref:OmpA-like domain-containing protein n=1 Tax=hydrothermal vent metagenome TaxID=652676 RepID=A0A3B0ZAB0_9ZZZZ